MNKTKYIAYTSLFLALVTVSTFAIAIPMPNSNGYLNLGDAVIFLAPAVVGPVGAMLAGGLGSALADLILGYGVWAPASLIIKGLEGLVCGLIYRLLKGRIKKEYNPALIVLPSLSGGVIMLAGYFFATWIMTSSPAVAALSSIENSLQIAAAIVVSVGLYYALKGILSKLHKK